MVTNPLWSSDDNNEVENPFKVSDDSANVMVEVEDTLLYVNAGILKVCSPVFNAMLSNNFIEGQQKKIDLPGKKACDVIRMFRFFYPEKKIQLTSNFDFYPILLLCEEYQLDWLKDVLSNYMVHNFYSTCADDVTTRSDEMALYFLYLAEQFKMINLERRCFTYSFECNFLRLKKIKTFHLLSKESRLGIFQEQFKLRLVKHDAPSRKICSQSLETNDDALFNYIDALADQDNQVEEDIQVESAAKKRKIEDLFGGWVKNPSIPLKNNDNDVIENPFNTANEINNVTLVVEKIELHLNTGVLQVYAPHWWKMISKDFPDDGLFPDTFRKVELKEENPDNIINLLRFFHPDKEKPLKDYSDFFSLYQLCEKYKIDWLKNKITNYIMKRFNELCPLKDSTDNPTDKLSSADEWALYFLYLSEKFNIKILKEKCVEYSFQSYFNVLKIQRSFQLLSHKTRLWIYKYCIKRRLLITDFKHHNLHQKYSFTRYYKKHFSFSSNILMKRSFRSCNRSK